MTKRNRKTKSGLQSVKKQMNSNSIPSGSNARETEKTRPN
ncbi:hypothetical protein GCM10008967_19470 [Bacillus carboniphilus]|uniref:YuzL n=1 Tax=Bacillus carboniphilus TaxID=86663 RepID=A0ABP3FZH6_9BACI